MRFRTKTILGVALIEIVLLAILISSALSILRETNETELTNRVMLGGKLLAAAAKDALISQDLATLDSLVVATIESKQIDYVRIVDANGVVLAKRGNAQQLSRPFVPQSSVEKIKDNFFEWSSPVLAGGIRYGEVQLGVSTTHLNMLLASAQRWAAGVAGIEMLLVALFSWLLGSYLVRQLVALRLASQRLASGNFEYRVIVSGNDELAETAIAFNHMAQQLGEGHAVLDAENHMRLNAQMAAEFAQMETEDINEQLKTIFALSPDGFVSFDDKHIIKYINPAFTHMTTLINDDLIGLNETKFSELLSSLCIEKAQFVGIAKLRTMQRINSENDPVHHHKIELSGAGKRVLEVSFRESHSKGVTQILHLRDVTYETEVELLKSEFLATAAHELRTPMASIYGFSELMLAHEFGVDERREFLTTIFKQSGLMSQIINDLLDLARIEARRGADFKIARLDVVALLSEITNTFKLHNGRPQPEIKNIDETVLVSGDRNKLTQAISNVLSNAYKYSPDGGAISIEISTDLTFAELDTPAVAIRISDPGIGMTPEQLERVFERFYRADASGTIPGTGLGMSIVQEIIELHGGKISIDSIFGSGTMVTIWLPVIESSKAKAGLA